METDTTYKHPGGKLRRLGPTKCTEKELLSIIINTGTKKYSADQIAQNLMDKFGTVYDLQGKTLKELMEIEGIGAVKATQLAAVFELCRRIVRHIEKEL
jgi:DNA repair protein RadC